MRVPRWVVVGLALSSVLLVDGAKKKKKSRKAKPKLGVDSKVEEKCSTCRKFIKGFYKGFNETDTIHFTGESKGWTLDNEKFLGRYKMGEARLVEILEKACTRSDSKCHAFLSDAEETVEEWWAARTEATQDSLEEFLCVNETKTCCQSGRWGPKCAECPGGLISPCSSHGTCSGAGLRTGSGKCKCDSGWTGKACSKCKQGYYRRQTATDPPTETCESCDPACNGCIGPGPGGCSTCAVGYAKPAADPSGPCEDIDECALDPSPCLSEPEDGAGVFCKNTPGSHECIPCHSACGAASSDDTTQRCSGPNAADCLGECSEGYEPVAGSDGDGATGCVDVDECGAGHDCGVGKFCQNTDGAFECPACDPSCSTDGCTGDGPAACVNCKEGYATTSTGGACEDADECKEFPCAGAADCTNTDGSFECECRAPNVKSGDSAVCTAPERHVTAAPFPPSDAAARELGMHAVKDRELVFGSNITITDSESRSLEKRVRFPKGRFDTAPTVAVLREHGVCCGDEFEFAALDVSPTGFTALVRRTDSQSGWGQHFELEYVVYDSTAPAYVARTVEVARLAEGEGLGLEVEEGIGPDGEPEGVVVKAVTEGSASDTAGVQPGDRILAANGVRIGESSYDAAVAELKRDGPIVLILAGDNDAMTSKDEL